MQFFTLGRSISVGNNEVRQRGGGGCGREVLGGIALSDRGTGALTKCLPLEVVEVQLKAGGCFYVAQSLVATGCILTAHRCGLLPQVVEGTACAGDRSCADQSV